MAKHFVNPVLQPTFPGLGVDFVDAKIAMDQMDIGGYGYVNARTDHIDRLRIDDLKAVVRQAVNLGAGFDSRAYRLHQASPDVRLIEIDLADISILKRHHVESVLGKNPDWITFVPIDFNTQTLDEVLGNKGRPVVFLFPQISSRIKKRDDFPIEAIGKFQKKAVVAFGEQGQLRMGKKFLENK